MKRARRTIALALTISALASSSSLSADYFIPTDGFGVYQLAFSDLPEGEQALTSNEISLRLGGEPIPFWISDHDSDRRFGPGDHLEFMIPARSPTDRESPDYPVLLTTEGNHFSTPGKTSKANQNFVGENRGSFGIGLLQEKDDIRTGFSLPDFSEIDHFYWSRLSPLDASPFSVSITNSPVLRAADRTGLAAKFSVRGATRLPGSLREIPEHCILIETNAQTLTQEWSGAEEQHLYFSEIPLEGADSSISVRVPARNSPTGDFLADIVFLNWIYWEAPLSLEHLASAGSALPLHPKDLPESGEVEIVLPPSEEPFFLYSTSGTRWSFPPEGGRFSIPSKTVERFLLLRNSLKISAPKPRQQRFLDKKIVREPAPTYLVVCPEMLLDGARKIAQLHEKNGRPVTLLTTEEIGDHFGYGKLSGNAIRDAIGEWFFQRAEKSELFVLLVGDASWEKPGKGRNLIPSFPKLINGNLCASDNPYACHEGDDEIPEIAVGRLPVATPDELHIVSKKLINDSEANPLPKESETAVLVTDHVPRNQNLVHSLGKTLVGNSILVTEISASEEEQNLERLSRIRDAITAGPNLILFHGHGSRHVWRTGPADLSDKSSILDSEVVSLLANQIDSRPARIAFGSSCDNAPFDSPSDDSLGERFLLAGHGGSLAFIGASWRVVSSSQVLTEWIAAYSRNSTAGQAFLEMKRNLDSPQLIVSYNLLGDPATKLRPSGSRQESK